MASLEDARMPSLRDKQLAEEKAKEQKKKKVEVLPTKKHK